MTALRCSACGNKTRFDVTETKRVRSFIHFTLGGDATVEEEEILQRTVERAVCRWCGSAVAIEGGALSHARPEAEALSDAGPEAGETAPQP